MKITTIRFYAAMVCLFTGFCFCSALYAASHDVIRKYLFQAEQSNLYQFYLNHPDPNCDDCTASSVTNSALAAAKASGLDSYGKLSAALKNGLVPDAEQHTATLPEMIFKGLLMFMAGFIFVVHWRLFRNLSLALR